MGHMQNVNDVLEQEKQQQRKKEQATREIIQEMQKKLKVGLALMFKN